MSQTAMEKGFGKGYPGDKKGEELLSGLFGKRSVCDRRSSGGENLRGTWGKERRGPWGRSGIRLKSSFLGLPLLLGGSVLPPLDRLPLKNLTYSLFRQKGVLHKDGVQAVGRAQAENMEGGKQSPLEKYRIVNENVPNGRSPAEDECRKNLTYRIKRGGSHANGRKFISNIMYVGFCNLGGR